MNTLLRIILPILLIDFLAAQTWCAPGATWHFRKYGQFLGYVTDGTVEYKLTNTVTVKGKICQELKGKFYGSEYFAGIPTPTGITSYQSIITYENNKVLLVYNPVQDRFDTIVDLNSKFGDSWFQVAWEKNCPGRWRLVVEDTSHQWVNSTFLKRIICHSEIAPGSKFTFYERMGCVTDFMYLKNKCGMDELHNGMFTCYSDDEFEVYKKPGTTECNVFMGVEENQNPEVSVHLFPNPNSGIFTVSSALAEHYTLYNYLGEIIYDKPSPNSGKVQIDISGKAPGLFFLVASSPTGKSVRSVLIE